MKKIKYFFFAIVALTCLSCTDDSGEYVDYIHPDDQVLLGLRACLKTAVDTANAHLCVANGFSAYDNNKYTIGLPSSATAIKDTLEAHGQSAMVDSLLSATNRAAESVGDAMKTSFSATISSMSINSPNEVLRGSDDAATTLLQLYYDASLKVELASSISSKLKMKGASDAWNQMVLEYGKYCSTPVNIDFEQHVINQIFVAFYAEMKIEEANIRNNPTHRVSKILKSIFGNEVEEDEEDE